MIDIMLWEGDPPGVYKNDLHRCRKRARCNLCDKTLPGCNDYYAAGKQAEEAGWLHFVLPLCRNSSLHVDACEVCSQKPLAEIVKLLR